MDYHFSPGNSKNTKTKKKKKARLALRNVCFFFLSQWCWKEVKLCDEWNSFLPTQQTQTHTVKTLKHALSWRCTWIWPHTHTHTEEQARAHTPSSPRRERLNWLSGGWIRSAVPNGLFDTLWQPGIKMWCAQFCFLTPAQTRSSKPKRMEAARRRGQTAVRCRRSG